MRNADSQPTENEIRAAALQFVRKISGYRIPSQANVIAFEGAVDEIATASLSLLISLKHRTSPQNV